MADLHLAALNNAGLHGACCRFEWAEVRKAARWGSPVLARMPAPKHHMHSWTLLGVVSSPIGHLVQLLATKEHQLKQKQQLPKHHGRIDSGALHRFQESHESALCRAKRSRDADGDEGVRESACVDGDGGD